MDEREAALDAAHRAANSFLSGLADRPVWPRATPAEMTAALGGPLPPGPTPAAEVIELLATAADPGICGVAGPRFFGFVIGGGLPAALGADWLTSAWDQNAGLTALSPAAAAAEEVAAGWLLDLLGLPPTAAVGFVTGAMMANFACLAAARHAVLAARDWNVADLGMAKAPPIRLVVGQDRHATIDRAARFLGLGRQDVLAVPADEAGRMLPDALEQALGVLDGPVVVCLQAGEVHTGAFDDFPSLIPLAHARNAWVHVDGAFGLWAAASPGTRSLLAGVDAADSWTTDAHKTLNVPYDSGLAIVRRPEWARAAFSDAADYLIRGSDDPFERTPEFSRRARGFAVWAALRSLGTQGVADLVQRLRDNAAGFAERLRRIPGVTVVNDVVFTQVLFRLESDEATVALGPAVLAEGTCVVTPGTWGGRPVQRCSMSSWATREQDLDAAAAAIERLVA